jgi:hypothetical protein
MQFLDVLVLGATKIYEMASLRRSAFHRGSLQVSVNVKAHPSAHGVSKEAHNLWHI